MSRVMATSALVASLAATAYAHGRVTSISAGGQTYDGFLTEYLYGEGPPADLVAWSAENGDNGFVDGNDYGNAANIACHKGGAPGGGVATVAAGGTVEVTWGTDVWPESHHGPVLDYLAKCAGDCTSASAADLSFFKIGEAGLNDGSTAPGNWASDDIIANNGKWSVTIPEDLAPGQYVYRHEIIALHAAGETNGAQNYPQCFNLEVTGGGSAQPESTPADQLYSTSDPGIQVSIYTAPLDYTIPGPALYGGGGSSGGPTGGDSKSGDSPAAPAAPSSADSPAAPAAPTSAPAYGGQSSAAPVEPSSAPPVSLPMPTSASMPASAGTGVPSGSTTGYVAYPTEGAPYPMTSSAAAAEPTYSAPSYGGDEAPESSYAPVDAVTEPASSAPAAATSSAAAPQPTGAYGGAAPSYGSDDSSEGSAPSYGKAEGPAGVSLKDLLRWTKYYITKGFNADGKHARDVVPSRR